jgi:hypothetical protein
MDDVDQRLDRRRAIKAQVVVLLNELERLGPIDLALMKKVRRVRRTIRPRLPAEAVDALTAALGVRR